MSLPYQTLHSHTLASDGEHTYSEVLDICKKNKIGVVAFTDHDSVPEGKELQELARLKDHEVKYIIGIELSSGYPTEIGGVGELFHVVGLFLDPTEKSLIEYTKQVLENRLERVERTVKNLKSIGFSLTLDEVLRERKGKSIGRPHIVKALMKKKENLKRLEEIEKKFFEDKEYPGYKRRAKRVKEADTWQKFFELVLSERSYINKIYVPYGDVLDFDGTVNLIHGVGGVALLAHWTFSKPRFGHKKLEELCRAGRVDGLETIYGFGEIPSRKREIEEDRKFLQELVKKYDLVYGGGGDFHTEEDFSLMLKEKELAEETKGLVDNILEKKDIDLTWSTLKR